YALVASDDGKGFVRTRIPPHLARPAVTSGIRFREKPLSLCHVVAPGTQVRQRQLEIARCIRIVVGFLRGSAYCRMSRGSLRCRSHRTCRKIHRQQGTNVARRSHPGALQNFPLPRTTTRSAPPATQLPPLPSTGTTAGYFRVFSRDIPSDCSAPPSIGGTYAL